VDSIISLATSCIGRNPSIQTGIGNVIASAAIAFGNFARDLLEQPNSGNARSTFPQTAMSRRSVNSTEEDNRRMLRMPQVPIKSFDGLPFCADDIKDAVTIAAASQRNDINQIGYVCGVPRRNVKTRYILVGNQTNLERCTSEDSRRKVNTFLAKLDQSQMFFFKNGMIRTRSGLQATIVWNEQLGKLFIYFDGTDLMDPHRGPQTILADVGIASGVISPMFNEAVELANCAISVFGRNVVLSGHSLGGSVCQFASTSLLIPGIAINSAPVNEGWMSNLPNEKLRWVQENSCQISVNGDIFGLASEITNSVGYVQLFKKTMTIPYKGDENPHRIIAAKAAVDAWYASFLGKAQG
jgi:hypothetical protein